MIHSLAYILQGRRFEESVSNEAGKRAANLDGAD